MRNRAVFMTHEERRKNIIVAPKGDAIIIDSATMTVPEQQPLDMTGQWIGWSQPDNHPRVFITTNTEPRAPHEVLVTSMDANFHQRHVGLGSFKPDGNKLSGKTWNYMVYDPAGDRLLPILDFCKQQGMQETPATEAEYTGEFDGQKISGQFKNNIGRTGRFELWRSFSQALTAKQPAPPKTLGPMSWDQFKNHVSQYHRRNRILFRGQDSNLYPLRTTLHRRGRNNLFRYLTEDVDLLRHRINAISVHYYQSSGEDLLGLLSLAQHHGFPTPLLDWSESPYVAAFFAFDCLTDKNAWLARKCSAPVRIFTFDRAKWDQVNRQRARTLRDPCPDFQFTHPPAHNNPRYNPQQSVAAFSTVEDIEGFVAAHEQEHKQTFITRIDVHAAEREQVEDDLRFMGITAATLFPGFEGACKSLAAELF